MSLCVYALVHVSACTRDHAPRIFGKYIPQSEVKLILAIILHLSPVIQLTLCVHPSMHACVCVSVCACMHMCMCLHVHVSVHNIMCSAGPEVAVLDWYGPEADPVYWQRGRGGGGGRTLGSM